MFNNFSFRISQKNVPQASSTYLYNEIRNQENFNALKYMEIYYEYISKLKLDENDEDYAMTMVTSLATNPELINVLENIYREVIFYSIDIDFLKYLYVNFDKALYFYVKKNFKTIMSDEYNDETFFKLPESTALPFFLSNKEKFIIYNGFNASQVDKWFRQLDSNISMVLNKLNSYDNGFELIEFYLSSEPYILPIVFNKKKSLAMEKRLRTRDINSNNFKNILNQYISDDLNDRKEMVFYLNDAEKFLSYISETHEDFIRVLSGVGEINDEIYNFPKIQKELSELYFPDSMTDWGYKRGYLNFERTNKLQDLSRKYDKNELNNWINEEKDEKKGSELKFPSKHFKEFNLGNSSNSEIAFFAKLEKLGLHAIPTGQKGQINLLDENNEKFAFRIDFILPCNVREYDGENYTLKQDIVFIGEYFGFYGAKYDKKKEEKINWQNKLEKTLDQKCVHLDPNSDICSVLKEKNIDSRCYPDFRGFLINVNDANDKKLFFVKSQLQNFIYSFLVNELLWQINYNYNLKTTENFNKVKDKNKMFLDRYKNMLDNLNQFRIEDLVKECNEIINDYRKIFVKERSSGIRSLRLSKTYNNRKNPSN